MEPAEYVVAHVVTALAEDPRTHLLGIEVAVVEHRVRLAGCVDSAAERTHVIEVVNGSAPGWRVVDDLVVCRPADRGVGEEDVLEEHEASDRGDPR
ncbi:MAG TPA: BON domain-containing protein [Microthrixaceae bacterium]|nr:BON domain-containing protein [Microthrixaceae bacterium]